MLETIDKKDLITIRESIPEDHSFIMSTLLKGLYHGDAGFNNIKRSIFMQDYHTIGEALLAAPGTTVIVACLKDEPGVILGYSILANTVLHYVFVKKSWRSIGIAKMLIPLNVNTVTHLTKVGLAILNKHPNLIFNPLILNKHLLKGDIQ